MSHARTPRGREEIRRSNLSAALAIVHDRGPLSRAQLVAALGLGRTTVFELLGQLAELGLITEGGATPAGVGRPSLLVQASATVGAFVVNPEVQALTVGIITLDGSLATRTQPWTPLPAVDTADLAVRLLQELQAKHAQIRIAGIGAGVPGQVDAGSRYVVSAPSIGWQNVDFRALLAQRLQKASYVENNARLVAATLLRDGRAQGCDDFLYLFANAGGIGGGIVSGGRILVGSRGFAGEIGHIHVTRPDAEGTVESLIRRTDLVAALGLNDADDDLLDELVSENDDPAVRTIAEHQLGTLGVTIANLVNALDVRVVFLGGFLGSLHRRFPDLLQTSLRTIVLPSVRDSLDVRAALHTTESVLRGAGELVFSGLVADPLGWPT